MKGGVAVERIGLYLHIPFCVSKCPYCDFYSLPLTAEDALDRYTDGLLSAMEEWATRRPLQADSLYFGGGTPSLLRGERLARLIRRADELFGLLSAENAEITLEANPADNLEETLAAFAAAGGNRLSLGMQSACADELAALGRRHSLRDVERTVGDARRAGLENISLDVMLGITGQTEQTARASVRTAAELGATHLSAYLLKIEPDTPYGHCPPPVPDEDAAADLYLAAMEEADCCGYHQYEISNAARRGFESRHNLKYWDSRPYLGLGPAAASCMDGRRFVYGRDMEGFLQGQPPREEPAGSIPVGGAEEYALLRLRLTDGILAEEFTARFGEPLPSVWRQRAAALPTALVQQDEVGIRLTRQGFLLSNTLIGQILGE